MNKKIVFIKYIPPLHALVEEIARTSEVVALYESRYYEPHFKYARSRSIKLGAGGIEKILKFFHLDISPPYYVKDFKKIFEEEDPTHIVVPDMFRLYFWQVLRYKKNHPAVRVILYSETKTLPKNPITRLVMRCALWYLKRNLFFIHQICAFTEEGVNFFTQKVSEAKVTLMPLPIVENMFYPDEDKEFLPSDNLRILMPARFMEYKEHRILLEALKYMCDGGQENFSLTLVGKDGFYKKEVMKQIKDLNLTSYIKCVEKIDLTGMRDQYLQHDIVVLPSRNEAIGMVIPEAMACGVPVIVSDTVGAKLYVEDSVTGWIFPTGDFTVLSETLAYCYERRRLQQMGNAAYEHMKQKFSPEIIARSFWNFA